MKRISRGPRSRIALPIMIMSLSVFAASARASQMEIVSDATWRTTKTSPPTGWNSLLTFDDSDAAGWQNAFKSPAGNHIWYGDNKSKDAPNNAWFRYIFTLTSVPTSATGDFFFDDDGTAYINGQLIIDDSGKGAITHHLILDPSTFVIARISLPSTELIRTRRTITSQWTSSCRQRRSPAACGFWGSSRRGWARDVVRESRDEK